MNYVLTEDDDVKVFQEETSDLIRLFSLTKSIVSLAASQFIIESIDNDIGDLLDLDKFRGIKLFHILNHTSGIKCSNSYDMSRNMITYGNINGSVYDYVMKLDRVYGPGEKYEYNNNAVELLGLIIKKVTGKNVEELVVENILKPLGITKYEWDRDSNNVPYASHGLHLSTRDLYIIARAVQKESIMKEYVKMVKQDPESYLFYRGGVSDSIYMWGAYGQIVYITPHLIFIRHLRLNVMDMIAIDPEAAEWLTIVDTYDEEMIKELTLR